MSSVHADQFYQLSFLGGMTATDIWPLVNPTIMPAWALLMLAPRWKHTKTITILLPLLHALLYTLVGLSLLTRDNQDEVDFLKLDDIIRAFQDPNVVFFGWIHYLVHDVLVARMIVLESERRGASMTFHFVVMIPVLCLTLMFSPSGFLLYQLIQAVALPEPKQKKN